MINDKMIYLAFNGFHKTPENSIIFPFLGYQIENQLQIEQQYQNHICTNKRYCNELQLPKIYFSIVNGTSVFWSTNISFRDVKNELHTIEF